VSDQVAATVDQVLIRHQDVEGALLPVLHEVQQALGHIPKEAVPQIAAALNLSRAEVHGVVTFYHGFRQTPPARRVVKLCLAEACQASGADAAVNRLCQAAGLSMGEARADGSLAIEPVYCLGLCASGPAALVDDQPRARLSGARLEALASELAR
jgi:formate dehydrogenase subunit gamma